MKNVNKVANIDKTHDNATNKPKRGGADKLGAHTDENATCTRKSHCTTSPNKPVEVPAKEGKNDKVPEAPDKRT